MVINELCYVHVSLVAVTIPFVSHKTQKHSRYFSAVEIAYTEGVLLLYYALELVVFDTVSTEQIARKSQISACFFFRYYGK